MGGWHRAGIYLELVEHDFAEEVEQLVNGAVGLGDSA
jgi:hypothetical protein